MPDDSDSNEVTLAAIARLQETDDEADRLARIRALSDETLTRYYALLSDSRYIINAPALPLLEAEIKARGLPMGKPH
jgi:hypothetical protein